MSNNKEFVSFISKKMSIIPDFIDTTSSVHYMVWGSLCEVNLSLLKLVTKTILSEKTVFRILNEINNVFDELDELLPSDLQLKVLFYFMRIRTMIEDWSIRYEFYETSANINRFNEIYLQNNPIT
jgi:hypothetical protein